MIERQLLTNGPFDVVRGIYIFYIRHLDPNKRKFRMITVEVKIEGNMLI